MSKGIGKMQSAILAALTEAAEAAGMAPEALRRRWAGNPDALAYLAWLREHGPATYGQSMRALGWGGTRAWQAEAALRAAGLVEPVKNAGWRVKDAR